MTLDAENDPFAFPKPHGHEEPDWQAEPEWQADPSGPVAEPPVPPVESALQPTSVEFNDSEIPSYSLDTLLGPPLSPGPSRRRPPDRIPTIVDVLFFALLLALGFLVSTGALAIVLYRHLFGLRDFAHAQNNTAVALGTQLIIYLVALLGAAPLFRASWNRDFFDGLHWHGSTARRLWLPLSITAVLCNLLAILVDQVVPYPKHAPIDKLFSTPVDAWMLFAFGVLVAPFFEEMIFRGFLLPAAASAWDWTVEHIAGASAPPLDPQGNPVWSWPAMVFSGLLVSIPFALMHSEQVSRSWGPLILLYCVSLVLCTVRFATRSLAASTLMHSTYNFILFAIMMFETDGFRHLDKL